MTALKNALLMSEKALEATKARTAHPHLCRAELIAHIPASGGR